jgi:hypothetical protein
VLGVASGGPAAAASAAPEGDANPAHGPPRVGAATATRAVAAAEDRERRLAERLAAGDRSGVAALLADEFAFVAPGADPVEREAWLAGALGQPAGRRGPLDVLERSDVDLVSFLARTRPPGGHGAITVWIVDTWRRADGRLLARHEVRTRDELRLPSGPNRRG